MSNGFKHGIPLRAGGMIELYDGTVLKRGKKYCHVAQRELIIREWRYDIKRLPANDQYYFVITPTIPKEKIPGI